MKFLSQLSATLALMGSVLAHPVFDELMEPVAPLKRAQAALSQVTNFGPNSSGARMYIYVPNNVAAKPAVIVAIHYCTGSARAYYSGSPYAQLSDQKGFIVIYPESPYSGSCWDVSSRASLSHNGGGNSNSIANMVTYALERYNGDASKVFVTGSSSGGMMTVSGCTFDDKQRRRPRPQAIKG
jgi:acetylxylan esterase